MIKQVIRVRLLYAPGEKALEQIRAAHRAWSGEQVVPPSRPLRQVVTRGRPWTWDEVTAWIKQHRG
jgi:hypothetical protein